MRRLSAVVVALLGAAALAAGGSASAAAPHAPRHADSTSHADSTTRADSTTAGGYVPVAPTRLAAARSVPAHGVLAVSLGSSVPDDATAAAVSVSLSAGAQAGVLSASAGSVSSAPKIATVSFTARQNVGDLAVVPVDGSGRLRFWSNSGAAVRVTVDLSGYYTGGDAVSGGSFTPEAASAVRVADTRYGTDGNRRGALPARTTMYAHIVGLAGVPQNASSVAATVTVIGATGSGEVALRTSGGAGVPATIQVDAGRQVSQLAVLPLADTGAIAIDNHTGRAVHIAVDVSGYYAPGAAGAADTTDTVEASTVATQSVGAQRSVRVPVAGRGGVPRTGASAAIVTLRVVKAATYGTLAASSGAAPTVVQFSTGSVRSGVVVAPIASDGTITVTNHSTRTNTVQVDVDGYVPGAAVPAQGQASTAHYLDLLTGDADHDQTLMRAYGESDAGGGNRFVLLDVGAQSVTNPPLTANNPGVSLANAPRTVRLTYAELVADVDAYLDGYESTAGGTPLRLAVGTNNDGAFDPNDPNYYAPEDRGRDWATKVIVPLRELHPDQTVLAADDIEYSFASTQAQAWTWENSYLAALPSGGSDGIQLIYNGDANSCPRTPGVTGARCGRTTWTQTQYYQLAYNHGHVQVLPQIFFSYEAQKWANIDRSGNGAGTTGGLDFAGSLTEYARDSQTYPAADGRAALYRALSAERTTPSVPTATDIS